MSTSSRKQPSAKDKEEALLELPQRITELVEKESDRGVILILGAYIDEILGLIIAAACVSDAIAEGILKHGQPAGTFDARLVLAQALGLIHDEDVKALRIIQKVRNKAAHFDRTGRGFDVLFDSPTTADQIVELSTIYYEKLADRSSAAVRASFVDSARNVATRLLMRRPDIKRPMPAKSMQDVVSEALSLDPNMPLAGLIAKLHAFKDSPEGKAMYQEALHFFSKMQLTGLASPDGNGLPNEMLLALSDLVSRNKLNLPPNEEETDK